MGRPKSQAEIAEAVGCSRSLVSKVVGMLERKRYVHRPTRTMVAVANQQYLVLYWAFLRDIEQARCIVAETSLTISELEEELGGTSRQIAFTAYTAAKKWGVYETPYSDVYAYDLRGEAEGVELPKGRTCELHLFPRFGRSLSF